MPTQEPLQIDFSKPTNSSELALFLGTSIKTLENLSSPSKKEAYFEKHEIPKRNPKHPEDHRVVWEPHPLIADVYKTFLRRFDLYARFVIPQYPHAASYGYTRGRSTLHNAQVHCGAAKVLHADIDNFFNSISKGQIEHLLIALRINPTVAKTLSEMLTINECLPLGLHSSPLLADLVCLGLDAALLNLAKKYDCKYTRYADDISISGQKDLPSKEEVGLILSSHGFMLADRKFGISKLGQAHFVTGLSITDARPRIPRKMKKRLRQELYFCKKFGIADHIKAVDGTDRFIQAGINRIDGMTRYISHIEGEAWPDLKSTWENLLDDEGLSISYPAFSEPKIEEFVIYIDEAEIAHNDKKYLALSLVRTEAPMQIEATTQAVLQAFLVDPFSGGRKEKLEKVRLHHTDANLDLRTAYIDKLAFLPFKGYITFRSIDAIDDYRNAYLSQIREFLPHRLMTCNRALVHMYFEENSKIKKSDIEKAVNDVLAALENNNNRRPIQVNIHVKKKAEIAAFSAPDFLLGVFAKYACSTATEKEVMFFEKLRDKYRIIFDADKNLIFSRKRPFLPWR